MSFKVKTIKTASLVLLGAAVMAARFFWIAAGEIYDYEDTFSLDDDGASTDVVLCLAGGKGRISAAAELWLQIKYARDAKRLSLPILFLSGVGTAAKYEDLAEQGVSKKVLAELTKEHVVFENVSENTFENAQIFSSFARQNKWKSLVLVTAGYHMRRAAFILKKTLDKDVVIKTETVDAVHFGRNEWHKDSYAVRVTLMEYIKWLYYRYSY